MLTLLLAKFGKIDLVMDAERILYLAGAELILFDAPMIVILFAMWKVTFS